MVVRGAKQPAQTLQPAQTREPATHGCQPCEVVLPWVHKALAGQGRTKRVALAAKAWILAFFIHACAPPGTSSLELHNLTLLLPPLPEDVDTADADAATVDGSGLPSPSLLAHVFVAATGSGGSSRPQVVLRGVTLVTGACRWVVLGCVGAAIGA